MPTESGFHTRGYLPHLKVAGAAYFVTFRLADSLPREVVIRLKEQRDDVLSRSKQRGNDDAREWFASYASELDAVLDTHRGHAWMSRPTIAKIIADSLYQFDGQRHTLHAWCVMPNHVRGASPAQTAHPRRDST